MIEIMTKMEQEEDLCAIDSCHKNLENELEYFECENCQKNFCMEHKNPNSDHYCEPCQNELMKAFALLMGLSLGIMQFLSGVGNMLTSLTLDRSISAGIFSTIIGALVGGTIAYLFFLRMFPKKSFKLIANPFKNVEIIQEPFIATLALCSAYFYYYFVMSGYFSISINQFYKIGVLLFSTGLFGAVAYLILKILFIGHKEKITKLIND